MRVKVGVLVAGVGGAILGSVLVLADGETVHGAGWAALPLAIWWLIPFAIGVFGARSRVGSVLVATVVAFAVMGGLTAIYTSDSSTAAIGLFTLPVLVVVLVAVCLLAERLLLRLMSSTR